MNKRWIMLPLITLLTGCTDPLAGIERVSEMDDMSAENVANALPSEEELNRDTPIFAGLFRGPDNASAPDQDNGTEAANKQAAKDGEAPAPRKLRSNGPDARDVPFGTVLPFGEIARVCEARGRKLGKLVEKTASRGARYRLYDSTPSSAAPRTFYVKGFKDNCPRQFTAALALFGSAEMYEQLRYGLPAKELPYSETDKAYERVKSQVCGVSRSKPCGRRISRLEQTTVFVSTYENFSDNARWTDILIHNGSVLAASLKKR